MTGLFNDNTIYLVERLNEVSSKYYLIMLINYNIPSEYQLVSLTCKTTRNNSITGRQFRGSLVQVLKSVEESPSFRLHKLKNAYELGAFLIQNSVVECLDVRDSAVS